LTRLYSGQPVDPTRLTRLYSGQPVDPTWQYNVIHTQPIAQPIYNTPEASQINASSSSALSVQDNTTGDYYNYLFIIITLLCNTIIFTKFLWLL